MSYSINLEKVVLDKFDGEVVLINLDNGNYFSIRAVAATVWELIEKGCDKRTIVENISTIYNVAQDTIEGDISEFLESLIKESLVEYLDAKESVDSNSIKIEIGTQAYQKPLLEVYSDMQDLILLDPIHDVTQSGWPNEKDKPDAGKK